MKKTMKRVFAILMTLAIAITAIPMMEAKAEETKEVTLTYYWYDVNEGSSYHRETIIIEDDMTYGEFEESYLPTPETDENFNFIGWESDYDPDNVVADGARLYYDAMYDKYPVDIVKVYVNGNNDVIVQEFKNYYELGTTFAEILPEYTEMPNDMGTQYEFTKWNTSIYPAEEVNMNKTYCEIFADYADHNIVKLSYDYVQDNGEYGVPILDSQYVIVEKDIALCGKENTTLQEYFETNCAPADHYAALGFTDWEWWNGDNWDAEEANDNEWALYVSNYSNAQIIFDTDEGSFVYAPIPGETLELPTELDGNNVSWACDLDGIVYTDSYTIPEDLDSNDEITLTAIMEETEKEEILVVREVYDLENGWNILSDTYTVNENATVEEIIEILPDAEDLDDCKFTGWKYVGNSEVDIPTFRAIYEKNIVDIAKDILAEDGYWDYEIKTVLLNKDVTYTELIDSLEDAEDVMGCSFVGWKLFDEDIALEEVVDSDYVNVEAVYDKYPVYIEKLYLDNTGTVKCDKFVEIYEAGTKMEDIYDANKELPTGATEWYVQYNYEGAISTNNNEIFLVAQYDDVEIVEFMYEYAAQKDTYGQYQDETYYAVLDKTICQSEDTIKDYFESSVATQLNVTHYDKFRFEGWDYWTIWDSDEDGFWDFLYVSAIYNENEKIVVHAWMDNTNPYVYVVSAGEVIQLPTEIEGYYYTWYEGGTNMPQLIKDGIYTVPKDATVGDYFMVEAVKGEKVPEQITPPGGNEKPGDEIQPGGDEKPGDEIQPDGDNEPGDDSQSEGEATPPAKAPETGDVVSVLPYMLLLLFGAGVFMVGNKCRNFVR